MKEIFGIFGKKKKSTETLAEQKEGSAKEQAPQQELSAQAKAGVELLNKLISKMGFQPNISAREDQGTIFLDMQGNDLGRLIGKEGNTLNALQILVAGALSRKNEQRVFVKVDANNYRTRREQTLCRIARDAAQMAVHQQKPVELEPMPANERRVIHAELSGRKDVHTYSTGDRQSRRIIVALGPAEEAPRGEAKTAEEKNK